MRQKPKTIGSGTFFFQAEDGIRDADVTGVQTCALPIFSGAERLVVHEFDVEGYGGLHAFDNKLLKRAFHSCDDLFARLAAHDELCDHRVVEIGRASCRERVQTSVWGGSSVQEMRP